MVWTHVKPHLIAVWLSVAARALASFQLLDFEVSSARAQVLTQIFAQIGALTAIWSLFSSLIAFVAFVKLA